jgi:hypothetical protein
MTRIRGACVCGGIGNGIGTGNGDGAGGCLAPSQKRHQVQRHAGSRGVVQGWNPVALEGGCVAGVAWEVITFAPFLQLKLSYNYQSIEGAGRGDCRQDLQVVRGYARCAASNCNNSRRYLAQVDPSSPSVVEIYKDVGRTFPEHEQ